MFRIEMLPAAHGDCLWIEYGSGSAVHRILIDGGPAHAYPALRQRILHLPAGERRFDLLVITHIDADHIEGVIRLLLDAEALVELARKVDLAAALRRTPHDQRVWMVASGEEGAALRLAPRDAHSPGR